MPFLGLLLGLVLDHRWPSSLRNVRNGQRNAPQLCPPHQGQDKRVFLKTAIWIYKFFYLDFTSLLKRTYFGFTSFLKCKYFVFTSICKCVSECYYNLQVYTYICLVPELWHDSQWRSGVLPEQITASYLHPDGEEVCGRHRGSPVCQVSMLFFAGNSAWLLWCKTALLL
jgi:hypothetical protein